MSILDKRGFTMVELMVSMVFISVLLLAIAMLILQITSIYNKGLTMREANQTGQFITSELQRALNQTYTEEVFYEDMPGGSGARLCAGTTIYAWNYADHLDNGTNRIGGSADVRFVKFNGSPDDYCVEGDDGWSSPNIPSDATELLAEGNSNIALHSFTFGRGDVTDDSTQTIYSMTMVVGTTNTGLIIGNNCQADDKIADERCAINEFRFTARSGDKEDT